MEFTNFHSSRYAWPTQDDDMIGLSYTETGDYVIEHRLSQGFWMVWNSFPPFEHEMEIEVLIKKVMGVEESYYGVVWNVKDANNYNYFLISANGYYQIGVSRLGQWQPYAEWTFTPLIKVSNRTNRLAIRTSRNDIIFEINGTKVNTFSKSYFFQKYGPVGFLTGHIMKIKIVASLLREIVPPDFRQDEELVNYHQSRKDDLDDLFGLAGKDTPSSSNEYDSDDFISEKDYSAIYDKYDPDLYDFDTRLKLFLP
jgi:hypothetical protein